MNPTVKTLPNGARLVSLHLPERRTVAVIGGVLAGSRDETSAEAGLSHFLEHLLFKGTRKYKDAMAIGQVIDDRGGYNNACTDKEATAVEIRIAADHGMSAVDVVMDTLTTAKLREEDIAMERGVILDEIRKYAADDASRASDLCESIRYEGSKLSLPVVGTLRSISRVTPDEVRAYYKRMYVAPRTVVAIVGNFSPEVEEHLAGRLSKMVSGGRNRTPLLPAREKDVPLTGLTRTLGAYTPRVHVEVMIPGPPTEDEDACTAMGLLAILFGGTSTSRLYQVLREQHGLCYSAWSNFHVYSDRTHFDIMLELAPQKMSKAIQLVGEELNRLRGHKITRAQLEAAKSYVTGVEAMHSENTHGLAMNFVYDSLLKGRVETAETRKARVERISLDYLYSVVDRYLRTPQTVIVAPEKHLPAAERLGKKHFDNLGS